ncbi:MAG: crotonase, partial [Thermodesulfobacteriota bacterium]
MMANEYIQFEKDGFVGTLTINRPKALNVLNWDTLKELGS